MTGESKTETDVIRKVGLTTGYYKETEICYNEKSFPWENSKAIY